MLRRFLRRRHRTINITLFKHYYAIPYDIILWGSATVTAGCVATLIAVAAAATELATDDAIISRIFRRRRRTVDLTI